MNDNRNRQYMWILMFVVLLTGSGTIASAQVQIELKPNEKSPTKEKPNFEDHRTIPAASLACTPEEAKWWNAVRTTSEAVRRSRGDKKSRKQFAELLVEGKVNSYTVPIADHKAIVLSQTEPQYTEEARRKRVGGFIGLRLEVLADGTVGKVRTLNSLGSGLDQNAIEAARKLVFLPAVKDRKFVDAVIQLEMSFNIY